MKRTQSVRQEAKPMTVPDSKRPKVERVTFKEKPFMFFSGASYGANSSFHFSNFYAAPVVYDGLNFECAENAFQSAKFDVVHRHRFAVDGDLSTYKALACFYPLWNKEGEKPPKNTAEGKAAYWSKKDMVGIVGKMCQNKHHLAKLPQPRKLEQNKKLDIFRAILRSKYVNNPKLGAELLRTGDRYLLEFCRGSYRREITQGQSPERWGGLAKETGECEWTLYGQNLMGKLHMEIRAELSR